jgi:peptidoglycan/xylan/chitin deacetylase (PgdA/CDA1 family)
MILCYHAVSRGLRSPLAVSPDTFAEQMSFLKEKGYRGLRLTEAERLREDGQLPRRWVVVTFDDGFASVANAEAALASAGFPGVVFVVTDFVERERPLSWPGLRDAARASSDDEFRSLTWPELQRLREKGWEIGSHTRTHRLLPRLSDEEAFAELHHSRAALLEQIGDCSAVAYPYGVADARIARLAQSAGYVSGCTLSRIHYADEPLLRPRIGLSDADRGAQLALQLSRPASLLRRSRPAREVRKLRRTRKWIPPEA